MSGKTSGLSAILKKFLNINSDIKRVSILTTDGVELISESRSKANTEESVAITSLVPAFVTSSDQAARLGLGVSDHSLVWLSTGHIVLQKIIQGLVMTILFDESANVGLIKEHISTIETVLKPFCAGFTN